ncbi:hypothetical protein CMV_022958 [Castanea mollissima]|uniref:DUF4283 domain-containing protein n=1 Tax=Castanea mollissima TaxID=60419 RepID=A0A8J4QL98_9ROSI|nr:hypothetical protein CMV_022958 [Castanea mollissima]
MLFVEDRGPLEVHGLPELWKSPTNLRRLGEKVGSVINLDLAGEEGGAWRKFIRIQVKVDLLRPLMPAGPWLRSKSSATPQDLLRVPTSRTPPCPSIRTNPCLTNTTKASTYSIATSSSQDNHYGPWCTSTETQLEPIIPGNKDIPSANPYPGAQIPSQAQFPLNPPTQPDEASPIYPPGFGLPKPCPTNDNPNITNTTTPKENSIANNVSNPLTPISPFSDSLYHHLNQETQTSNPQPEALSRDPSQVVGSNNTPSLYWKVSRKEKKLFLKKGKTERDAPVAAFDGQVATTSIPR